MTTTNARTSATRPRASKVDAAWRRWRVATSRKRGGRPRRSSEVDPRRCCCSRACAREEEDDAQAIALLRRAAAADPEWATPELWLARDPGRDEDDASRGAAARRRERSIWPTRRTSTCRRWRSRPVSRPRWARSRRPSETLSRAAARRGRARAMSAWRWRSRTCSWRSATRSGARRLRALTAAEPDMADAWYALGCAAEELEDEAERRAAWRRTWMLDAAPGRRAGSGQHDRKPRSPRSPRRRWRSCRRGPGRCSRVPIVIAELRPKRTWPPASTRGCWACSAGRRMARAEHWAGSRGSRRSVFPAQPRARRRGEDELREEIRTTLLHETGHFFGLDEAALEEMGLA